jgi:Ca2+-binding RTX toxin-like protein
MATLYAGTEAAVRMDTADIGAMLDGPVYDSSPTHMSVGSSGDGYRIFGGTGFTFGASGVFTSGTVTSLYISNGSGGEPMGIVGMSMSVATLKSYVYTGNTAGFLAAVFNGNDTLNGHSYYTFHDYLRGYNGHDVINGGAGNDTLVGDAGNDTLNGGIGNDTLKGDAGADKLTGGKGNDTMYVDSTTDTVIELAGEGNDLIYGSISLNLSVIGGGYVENGTVTGTANLNVTGTSSDNCLIGNIGANKLIGNMGNDTLFGLDGNDTMDGGSGIDTMTGGNGNDVYYAESTDILNESGFTGVDTVIASSSFSLGSGFENLTLIATADNFDGWGNSLDNKMTGNAGDNDLYGYEGKDTITGGNGNDYLNGGLGDDTLSGGIGNDTVEGGHGTNTINVADGNDIVRHQPSLDAYDIIQNFDGNPTGGQDVLDLDSMFDALGVGAVGRSGRVQLTDKGSSVDVNIDTNGDGTFEYLAAIIQSASPITVGEDVVVGS